MTIPIITTPSPARAAGTGCPSGHAVRPRGDAESFAAVLERSRGEAGRAPAHREADTAESADGTRADDAAASVVAPPTGAAPATEPATEPAAASADDESATSAPAGPPSVGAVSAVPVPGAPALSALASREASGDTNATVAPVPTHMATGATATGPTAVPVAADPPAALSVAAGSMPRTVGTGPAAGTTATVDPPIVDPNASPSLTAVPDPIATPGPPTSPGPAAALDTGKGAEAPVLAVTAAVAAPGPPAVSAAPTTTGEALAPGAPPAPPAAQVALHIVPLRRDADGIHRLTVHLHPADLGMVSLVAEIRAGEVHLQLVGATEAGREALRDALPDLRRELLQGGFSRCSLDLGQHAPQGGNAHRGDQTARARSTPDAPAVTPESTVDEETPTIPSNRRLDLRL